MEPFFTICRNGSKEHIKYFIDNKYKMPRHLLKYCIKKDLEPSIIDTIYNNYYNNSFIIELILKGKNKIALSEIQLKEIVILDNEICNLAIENSYNKYILKIFKYEDEKILKRKLIMHNKTHQYCNDYNCRKEDHDIYWEVYDTISKYECEYRYGYNDYDYILKNW